MGTQGTTTVDFGAFPGQSDTSVTVTGIPSIVSGSLVEAWLRLTDSVDHSADEHRVDGPVVYAGNIVGGTGFTIYAVARDGIPIPDAQLGASQQLTPNGSYQEHGRRAPMPYGIWNVQWVWN